MKWTRLCPLLLSAAGLVFLAGCSPSVGHLSGAVTFADKPVTEGQVTVYGADGQVFTGNIDGDGNYLVQFVPTGPVRIVVLPPGSGSQANEIVKNLGKEGKAAPIVPKTVKTLIPDRYQDPGQSGLATTVKSGDNKYDLVLTP